MPNATIIAQQLFVVYYKTEWTQHKNHSIIFLLVQLTTPPTVCIHSTNIVLYIETTSTQYILHVGSQTLSHTKKFPICATKTCNTCHYFVIPILFYYNTGHISAIFVQHKCCVERCIIWGVCATIFCNTCQIS